MDCSVYFVLNRDVGVLKIGHSTNVQSRLQSLQTGSAFTLELLGTVPGGPDVERSYHQRFESLRLSGEWFKFDQSLAAVIVNELGFCLDEGVIGSAWKVLPTRNARLRSLAMAGDYHEGEPLTEGQTATIPQLSRAFGINSRTLFRRVMRLQARDGAPWMYRGKKNIRINVSMLCDAYPGMFRRPANEVQE